MASKKSTTELDQMLGKINPDKVQDYLTENAGDIIKSEKAFSDYIREMFKEKGLVQQEIFLRADMPERYGYKIISGEKHTVQRDVIIRLCLASRFDLVETNRALKLYGFSELYSKVPRDAVIIVAINSRMWMIDKVNDLLLKNGFKELYSFAID